MTSCPRRQQQPQGRLQACPRPERRHRFSGCRILEILDHTLAILDLNANFACLGQQQLVEFGPVMSIYPLRDVRSLVKF